MKTYGPYRPEIAPRGRSHATSPSPTTVRPGAVPAQTGRKSPPPAASPMRPPRMSPHVSGRGIAPTTAMDKMNPLPGGCESRCAPSRGRRIRLHVYKHFPEGMCPHTPDGPSGNDLAHWRVAVLRRLAEFLMGVPQLENLCCLLDEQWHDPVGEVTPGPSDRRGNPGLKLENDVELPHPNHSPAHCRTSSSAPLATFCFPIFSSLFRGEEGAPFWATGGGGGGGGGGGVVASPRASPGPPFFLVPTPGIPRTYVRQIGTRGCGRARFQKRFQKNKRRYAEVC